MVKHRGVNRETASQRYCHPQLIHICVRMHVCDASHSVFPATHTPQLEVETILLLPSVVLQEGCNIQGAHAGVYAPLCKMTS